MGYRKRRVEEDAEWGPVEDTEGWSGEYAERWSVEDAGRGALSTGTGTPSDDWGLEEEDGWTSLVVRERTNKSASGESTDPAESPGDSTSSDPTPAADSTPSTPEVSLDDLSDLVDRPEDDAIDELGDRIIKLSAHMSAAEHRLLLMIGEFDRREGWKPAGHKDCAAWLEMYTGLNRVTARERVRVARALHELPETSNAMAKGELTFSKVRGLVRVATPENEAELLPLAKECTAHQLERELQRWRELEQWDDDEAERRRYQRRRLSVRPGGGGMYEIRGLVSPDVGALLTRVIDAAGDALFLKDHEWSAEGGRWGPAVKEVKPQQRRADALRLILERAMEAGFELPGGCGAPECEVGGGAEAGGAGDPAESRTASDEKREAGSGEGASGQAQITPSEDSEARSPGTDSPESPAAPTDTNGLTFSDPDAPATEVPASAASGSPPDHASQPPARERDSSESTAALPDTDAPVTDAPEPTTDAPERSCTCSRTPPSASAERYLVLFNVDQKTLEGETGGRAELDGEATVSLETARRLTCDSAVVRIVRGAKSEILDVGRKTRVIPPAIRRALWARDGGCRFPGCGSRHACGHHIKHWALGGKTSLDNLVLLCHAHHKAVHEGGFEVRMGRYGRPYFLDLNGCRIPDQAPPMALPASAAPDPVRAMVQAHRFRGMEPTNTTGSCRKVISPEKMDRFWEGLDPSE